MRSSILLFALVGCVGLAGVSPAWAQTPSPAPPTAPKTTAAAPKSDNRIPIAVLDARGTFARIGQDAITAAGLFTPVTNLSARAFGAAGGVHVYPIRSQSFAFGIGGEAILARASFEPVDATTKKPTGTVFNRRLRGISGQASLNFGHKLGWSYLTVGLGPTSFESYLAKLQPDGLRPMTLNFGGGARWFNFDHLAFTIDLRFYRTRAAVATPNTAARDNKSVMVMSAGFAIK